MPLPDAPAQRSDSERIALLELDVLWIKSTTNQKLDENSDKIDTLIDAFNEIKANLKADIKKDLHDEFEQRFVPKKALWIATGTSLGIGLVAGASFQPLITKFLVLLAG